jgi:uncharacterized protein (TIGR03435 family)
MKRQRTSAEKTLDRFFARAIHPSNEEADASRQRVLARIHSNDKPAEPEEVHRPRPRFFAVIVIPAAAAAAIAVSIFVSPEAKVDARITVQAVDGTLHSISNGKPQSTRYGDKIESGTLLRSAQGTRATLALADGSLVEVRPVSELSVEPASDGVRIRLSKGGIIVNAAEQRAGHLYVQTKDVMVSVVGTVFLVNAEEEGSRVAVIQGEVHVQHGATVKKLLPGDQVATGPEMPALPVAQEFSWSRNAPGHLALLQRSTAETVSGPAPRHKFEVVSIRPHSGVSPRGQESLGFVCRGVDGNRLAEGEHIGSGQRLSAPQGRCVGNGVFVGALIAFAYGVPGSDVLGVPQWAVEPDQPRYARDRLPANAFSIEATADDPSSATTAQLIEMVKTMLADRFQLKVRMELRDVPGYALILGKDGGKDGHKLKLKSPADSEQPPSLDFDASGRPIVRGKSTMQKFAQWLGGSFGFGPANNPVVDRTGLTEVYDYEFDLLPREPGGAGQRGAPAAGQAGREEPGEVFKNMVFRSLEDQLGLRLIPEKAIPIEVVVVEKVEKPSEN